ncbi:exported protein of unknown function [Candidatus Nitrospira inopinata]|jgi:hypothetical protein|uniref:Uncharacterized protein n=1 Tax=Candidatus Nitrospira inopinata TaxID=1715989 RepID=A0A0S4KTV9_9BACT|nr:exported protein of unknown function [Candidatus Nitrospira inopinata]
MVLKSHQIATAIGQARAFTAQADDPSAIQHHPDDILQLLGARTRGAFSFYTRLTSASGMTTRHAHGIIALPL